MPSSSFSDSTTMHDTSLGPELHIEHSLSILNARPKRFPGPHLLHQLVRLESDESLPAIHSLDDQGRESTWSYPQLHQISDRLASRISASVKKDSNTAEFVVPLLIPQCPHLYAAILAVLKAGGAFCPLHLDAPPERVRFILQDVSAKVVLVSRDLVSKIPCDDQEERIILVVDEEDVGEPPALGWSPVQETTPQRLAYVMYTSGSTGTPKGVGISHDAATQSLLAHNRHIPIFRRFLQFASPTFDVSVFEIFFPLLRGSTLVTCDRGRMLNDLPAVMRTLEVDACELTPTVAGSLLRSRQNAPCLKLLLTIGEMLTESVVKEFGGSDEIDSMLWGMYGPTEAAIHCTIQPQYRTNYSPSNIGFPLESVSCFVAAIPAEGSTYDFKILPLGEPGELVVGGYQLAKGYLNRPEQTSAAFLDTSFGRVYRTGDKAVMKANGTIECLGRISDGQVKLRGQRIELGEVEQAVMRTEGCHSAVAMVIGGILVAFCAVDDDTNPEKRSKGILDTCRTWLPSFMVPGDVVLKTNFPRLPSGKVDRKHLRSDYTAATEARAAELTPTVTDSLEREVAAVIFEALGIRATLSDHLASSGVDSLLAIKLASALRERGFKVSATEILGSRTMSALCSTLRANSADSEPREVASGSKAAGVEELLEKRKDIALRRSEIENLCWCTPLQNSMLAETSVNPQAYCNWIEFGFPEDSTCKDVENWVHHVISNNDIFRSGFVSLDRGFARLVFRQISRSLINKVDQFDFTFSLASEEDFLHPLRVQIRQSTTNCGPVALFQLHHALYDGWSADILINDLTALAGGQIPELRPSFQEVANFYSDAETQIQMNEARRFWADHLLGWQRHNLPRLMGCPPESREVQTVVKELNLPQSLLEETARSLQCHPQSFLQAGLLWLWAGVQGQTDVLIGSVSSGRTIPVPGIERVSGPCISTTPLRVNFAGLASVSDLIRNIQATNRQVLQHGILPLADIKKIAGVNPGDALFDVVFVYQESLYSQQSYFGRVRKLSHQDYLETRLLVEIEPSVKGLICRLTYHTDALSSSHATLLAEQLEAAVSHLLYWPNNPIKTIESCFKPELQSIYNANPSTLHSAPDLAACFEQSASLVPDATAIVFANALKHNAVESISYGSLNSLSNIIARHLRQNGLKEGGIVGLIMEKSICLYAAMLGILKAGGAYLPLLPITPTDRIQQILTQAKVEICLADTEISKNLQDFVSCKFIDVHATDMSGIAQGNICLTPNPSRPAYVIYTSGTTGKPKGVVVTQKNIVSNLDVLSRIYPSNNRSRFLQACSQAFDVSVFEIFFTWKIGACLCSGTNDTLFEDLERAIRFFECTHLSMTPTVASLVDPTNVPSVEFLVTAGEPMTQAVAKKWTGLLFQGYGPAETTNICTVKKMKPGDFIDHLGFSFENTSTFVLSSGTADLVPIGCVGELCFGGDQVAAGYLGMPDLTQSKFLDHPQLGRIYRSGDMGRMLPDGSLMVLGRMDDQLKLRGQRIDTGEISSILTTSGLATSSAVVIVNRGDSSSSQLAAFYVPARYNHSGGEILPIDGDFMEANDSLFGNLRSRLPTYMVPTYLVPTSSIPLTSSGKVDRSKLRFLFSGLDQAYLDRAAGSSRQQEDETSWSEEESMIRSALSKTLGAPLEEIARWQPFAAVGLDSISAISLARALHDAFNLRIPVSTILRSGSVALLAHEIPSMNLSGSSDRSQPATERLSSIWDLVEDNGSMDVPLVCELIPSAQDDSMTVKLHCNIESITREALLGLLQVFLHLVSVIATHPASSLPMRQDLPSEVRLMLDNLVTKAEEDHDIQSVPDTEEWNDNEKHIRSIVSELSDTPASRISRNTSIFQIGLDSINAVQLAAMMRAQGLELSALEVIEFPTCAKMASRLGKSCKQDVGRYDFEEFEQEAKALSAADGAVKYLPCSPLQCAMLNDFLQSEGKDYLNYMSFALNEGISMDQIHDAWSNLFLHHQILRTGFIPIQHRDSSFAMVQYAAESARLPLVIHENTLDSFNVDKWKLDTSHGVLETLHNPPWALALERCQNGCRIHLIMHHALYDAYSMRLILQDLSSYLATGRMSEHPPLEEALGHILQASVINEESQDFWKKKASEIVVNRFPTLTPLIERAPELVTASKIAGSSLSGLAENAKQIGVPVQVLLQAAWSRVLSAYLGEEDVVFGVVLSGRLVDETKDAIFPCINTVPVVAQNKESNMELLHQMMDYNNLLLKHQNAPLAQIQRWLGYPNTRVFDTLLVYQRMPAEHSDFPWHTISDEGNLDYPVSLEVEPLVDGTIQLRLSYRIDVLPTPQASQLLDQFDIVLRHLAESPNKSAHDLWTSHSSIFSITPPLEPTIPSHEQFLHSFVETKARTHPDKVAFEFVTGFKGEIPISRQWTFRELNERGNQVANVLASHTKVGHTIAIHFDKCPEACFSILGILKSGCAFLALDPSAPKARKEFILKDSGALALMTNITIDFAVEQPLIHVDDALLDSAPCQFTTPDNLNVQDNSYCLYTSGTTGTPKGCEITHENAVQAMKAFQRLFEGHWDDKSKWLQFASFHFDVSVLEQYWSWSVGMTLVGAPRDLILDDLGGTIRRLEITHIDLTPSLARLLDPSEVPSLSRGVFITGGEALKQEILDVWGPVGVIYNAYGPTEATIGVTMYQRVPQNGRASNIGKQFDNVGSYVLQPGTSIPVMKGAVGELCVSGKLVGKGYLNRPQLTEERFPYLESLRERVYRTGDLVRLLHDGCFDFLGRADDQVKLRGQRLEIGEINHSIRTRVAEVSDVATLVTKHGSLDKDLLVSFVSCKATATSKDELQVLNEASTASLVRSVQKACRDALPGYMVPSYIFQVPRIPLSPNNKADTKQLKQLFRTLTPEKLVELWPSSRAGSKPTNEVQRLVLSATEKFLGGDVRVALSSNIFDLGVDSISALRLSRLMRKHRLAGASPRVILRNPVLADLADALQLSESTKDGTGVQEAHQLIQAFAHRYRSLAVEELALDNDGEIEYVAPCTPLQEGMLSRFMSDQDEGAYFTAFRLRLSPDISIEKLKSACEKLVRNHAILRTSFIQTPAGFAQVAIKSTQLLWEDLRYQTPDEVETQLSGAMPKMIQKNRKNVSSPLQLLISRLGDETVLHVHIFHALYDGTSFETMLRWVSEEYLGQDHEAAPQFVDTLAHGPLANHDQSRQFWVDHLKHCSFDTLPRLQSGNSMKIITRTKTYSTHNLETLRRSLNVTLQSVVLALWTSVFKKHFPGDAATGVIVSGRSIDVDQIENTIGPLFNTLLFHAGIKEGDTWLSLIQKCHEFNTAVLQFQHVPLRNIQKWCTKSRGRPIFENLFVFQVEPARPTEQSVMWSIMDDYSVSDYPLAFEASATPDGQLRVQIVAHRDVANEETMISLFEEIDEALIDVTSGGTHSIPITENTSRDVSTAASPRTPLTSRPESANGDAIKDDAFTLNLSNFEWTLAATAVRKEISALSSTSEDSITENTTLLELGLDSIDLVKLSARLKHCGYELTLSQLMRSQTIAAMSQILNRNKEAFVDESSTSDFDMLENRLWKAVESMQFDLRDVEAILPSTPLQESMVADMLQSDFEQYFNHDILEPIDGLDLKKLESAWQEVIKRSPILRTVFVQVDDPSIEQTFAQVVLKANPLSINTAQTADIESVINVHKHNARAGQGRACLLQLSLVPTDTRMLLVFSISHALYDGWSLALLHQDVAAAYRDQFTERPPAKPFLQAIVKTPTDQSKRFWSQYLAKARPSLVSKRQPTREASRDFTHRTEAVSTMKRDQVLDFCKRQAISLQVLGQACWASTVATLLQTLEVTFGVVLAGRDSEQAQALMFPTMNTVAVRCVLHGSTTSFLRYLQESMGDVAEFQSYSIRKAQGAAGGRLFNTLFVLQKNLGAAAENPIMKSVQGSAATDFAVCAELEDTSSSLIWRIAGHDAFVTEKMTHQLLHQLDRALEHIVKTPDENILRFDGDEVSVCHLSPFRARTSAASSPESTSAELGEKDDSDWTDTEATIRHVLSQAADVDIGSINKRHTLYNLGLDSISAIKVSALLRKEGLNLGVRLLLTSGSIRNMAQQARPSADSDDKIPRHSSTSRSVHDLPSSLDTASLLLKTGLRTTQVEDILPALPMQAYMISSWQNSQGRVFYSDFVYSLQASVSKDQLEAAWAALVDFEPILRTCLVATGDKSLPFVQIVLQPGGDGPHRRVEIQEDKLQTNEEWPEKCWPQVKLTAEQDNNNSWLLRLNIQHSLYDGFSLPRLMEKLLSRLQEQRPVGSIGLDGWSSFLAAHRDESIRAANREFWIKYLDGVSPASALYHADESNSLDRISVLKRSAVKEVVNLQAACSQAGVGLAALFLAATARALQKLNGEKSGSNMENVAFGIYYANRSLADNLEDTFPTLNLVPIKVSLDLATDMIQIAKKVQDDLHLISSHSTVGLWEIRDWTGVEIDCFVNFLNLAEEPNAVLQQGELSLEPVSDTRAIQSFDSNGSSSACAAPWLKDNVVLDSFPDALDIEASVNGGGMDIGVFGSSKKVSDNGAEELIRLLSGVLQDLR
ncbi:Hydroxamate-type ferrichrome siderophore peptide synthetase [Colletotrichum chlorophyti]|uniref:Hydroxamate-type ferrichrome siderophore peptide synthetase n=1 Tax=Colletotrichum chlorophyti TaxID=708187 RepID=A0A1Q8S1C6_9PEZI|nr:Hydroxamate-type ferrichrome siderophore peptide synthetase [Colletotrichum chlorophyti]